VAMELVASLFAYAWREVLHEYIIEMLLGRAASFHHTGIKKCAFANN
jgi:hypothetical protein